MAAVEKTARTKRRKWMQENRARGIAFVIARAIKRRGLPAKHILGQAKPIITMQVLRDVEGVLARGVA
jgi:hypothetical protein